jgi:ADP-ribose pyrophosphatase
MVFENARFRVFADHINGAGHEVQNYLVVAPHTTREDLVTGITVLPVYEGRIVLLRNFRHATQRTGLEGVRGFVDLGEEPAHAALRELQEETGLVCDPENLVHLGFCAPEGSTLACRLALFAATQCVPGNQEREQEPGLGELVAVDREEAERLLTSIEDVSTVLALYRLLGLKLP